MSGSTKQKVNTRSSTESELVGVDDFTSKILWTKKFLEQQGYEGNETIVYQDNMSTIKLLENGRSSCGKRTRHLDIKYFFLTDLIKRKEVDLQYCPTEKMTADYMTKPLTGRKFAEFRAALMNIPLPPQNTLSFGQQEWLRDGVNLSRGEFAKYRPVVGNGSSSNNRFSCLIE